MKANKKTARAVGGLFIIGTVAGILKAYPETSILEKMSWAQAR